MFRFSNKKFVIICFVAASALFTGVAAAQQPQKVLVLNSYHDGYYWSDELMAGIKKAFDKTDIDVRLSFEYMDTKYHDAEEVFPHLLQLYKSKYENIKFDVIISSDNNAIEFLRRHRDALFPGTPVVFCGPNFFNDSMLQGLDNVTGIIEKNGVKNIIEVALKFHPYASRLVFIEHKVTRSYIDVDNIISTFQDQIEFEVIKIWELTDQQLINKVEKLSLESIVVLPTTTYLEGQKYNPDDDVRPLIMEHCTTAMYANDFRLIGLGTIGGAYNDGQLHGQITGGMAIKILKGRDPDTIPIIRKSPSDYFFDYIQLKHFRISPSKLPPRTTLYNEPESFYNRYKGRIWITIAIFAGLAIIVMALLLNIARRKRYEEKLLEYQAQLKSLASELSLVEERERRRIATDLHDRISQSLVISKVKLESVRDNATGKTAETIDEVADSIGQTIQETRSLTFDLSSPILHELGFEAAVAEWLDEQIEKKHGIKTEFRDDGQLKPLDDDIRILLFRDVRELLINAVKHSKANKIRVSIEKVNSDISVAVQDNGIGFNVEKTQMMAAKTGGFGLFSIRERLNQLGGQLQINSKPDHGTKIKILALLKQEEAIG